MGEYVILGKDSIKIGTCESLYYTRLNQLIDKMPLLKIEAGNHNPQNYLDPKHGWRYRFPFPDEDHIKFGEFEDFNRGWPVNVSQDFIESTDHDLRIRATLQYSYSGYKTDNIMIPCLFSSEFDKTLLKSEITPQVEIVFQKVVDEEIWTVIRCVCCHSMVRIYRDSAIQLADFAQRHNEESYFEIARRIMKGYK